MVKLEVSEEIVKKYLFSFFPSLKQYQKEYLPLILGETIDEPDHMAYICPLCLQNFIYYIPNELRCSDSFSLDHFPPENVGGRSKTLICKPCNNNAGLTYEGKLSEILEKECFNKKIPMSTLNASTTISNVRGWHKGVFGIDKNRNYTFDLTTKEIKNLPELAKWKIQPDSGDWEMKATIKHVDENNLTKSLLKTAYLYCFNHWGYCFVFSKSGELIRQVLNGSIKYPIKIPSIWLDNNQDGIQVENINSGVVFVSEPKELQSIFINVPIELKHLNYKCIIPIQIPNPTDNSIKEIQRINNSILEKNIIIKIAPIHFPNIAMKDSFSYTWNLLCGIEN